MINWKDLPLGTIFTWDSLDTTKYMKAEMSPSWGHKAVIVDSSKEGRVGLIVEPGVSYKVKLLGMAEGVKINEV